MEGRDNGSEAMRGMDHTLFSSLEDLRKQISDLRVAVASLPSRAGSWVAWASFALIVAVGGASFFLGSRLEGLQSSSQQYLSRVEQLETQTTTLASKTDSMSEQLAAQGARIETMSAAFQPAQAATVQTRASVRQQPSQ